MAHVHISESEKRLVRYAARTMAVLIWGVLGCWFIQSCVQLPASLGGNNSSLVYASVVPIPHRTQAPVEQKKPPVPTRELTKEEKESERERKLVAAIRAMRSSPYDASIVAAAEREGLDADLVRAVIYQESRFRPDAESPRGARGLMQLMPGTANDLRVTDRLNPHQNIAGGTKFLRQMIERFDGKLSLALAAYNAGPDNVSYCMCVPKRNRDGSVNTETPAYVRNILGVYRELQKRPEVAALP